MTPNEITAKHTGEVQIPALFEQYQQTGVVQKAVELAGYTLPAIMQDATKGIAKNNVLQYDYQSEGAYLVNNLTSKLVGALFPAGRPFFRLRVDSTLEALAQEQGISPETLDAGAAELERLGTEQLFKNAALASLHQVLRLLISTGNCLLYRDPITSRFIVWNLHSYAVRRDQYSRVQEIILKESVRYSDLTPEHKATVQSIRPQVKPEDVLSMYTYVQYDRSEEDLCSVQTFVESTPVDAPAIFPEHLCPYLALTWALQHGEHYGRGYVEEYSGDFAKLSTLSEYLTLYEVDSLEVLNLVDEAAGGVIDEYIDADTGAFVSGRAGAITAYERGDYNKIAQIGQDLSLVQQRLARAFMQSGQQRAAERVTAEEVRLVAQEAESLLGGTYSVLAESLQSPLAYLCMHEVALGIQDTNLIYEIMRNAYRPEILTGIPALTQASDTNNLIQAVQELQMIVPVLAELSQRFDTEAVIEMVMQNNSVPLDKISKSPEQLEEEARMQQEEQAALVGMQEAQAEQDAIADQPEEIA